MLYCALAVRPTLETVVVIADDEPVFAEGLRGLCEREGLRSCVTRNGQSSITPAIRSATRQTVVLGSSLPTLRLFETLRAVLELAPESKVLLFSPIAEANYVTLAWRAGAKGVALRTWPCVDVMRAIHVVTGGAPFVASPERYQRASMSQHAGDSPTPREYQVLELVASGRSSAEIAAVLGIARKTADHHRDHLRRKLGARTTADLVRIAVRLGIVLDDADRA